MNLRCVVVSLLAMMLGAAVTSVLPGAPASADPTATGSAMTMSGNGDFANLQVTVSQTKSLINQVVTVSWKGGAPTLPATGAFGANYLQIMQCWGDDPGPDRTQCQFGQAAASSPQAGTWVRSRQVSTTIVDPRETLKAPDDFHSAYVPFWAVGQPMPDPAVPATSDTNDFFDAQSTNEVPLARTHGDGTGLENFEVQTVRQAAGLGCGDPVTSGGVTAGRKCWLVIVPRGTKEVDGSTRNGDLGPQNQLNSSPLSQSNWANRIVFPLEFQSVGQACPLGSPERRVIGNELAVDAATSWQTALCASGTLFSYTELGDDVTRNQVLTGGSPGLAVTTNPIPPDQSPPEHPLVYAPLALSGLTIAFNIEHQLGGGTASAADAQLDGVRFTSMKLTPRLVAKLLTQSYTGAVEGGLPNLKNNPDGLTDDPEFLKLNPEYNGFAFWFRPPDALAQLGSSDLTSLLWTWVKDDPAASAFIAGTPDDNGMVVNPKNKGLSLPMSTFPRNDQSCTAVNPGSGTAAKSCTSDEHPLTDDMHQAGLAVSRGDSLGRTPANGTGTSVLPAKNPRQVPGQRALLAVVDAATAVRYGLPTASLSNAAGQFVAPTIPSLQAGAAAMKPSSVPGVLAADPAAADPTAYPLTALSYAVASPSTLDVPAGKDYATFLRYAAGDGQRSGVDPGMLPLGLAPLPDALKAQTIAAAATIEAQAGKTIGGGPAPQQPTNPGATTSPGTFGGAITPTGTSGTQMAPGGTVPGGTAPSGTAAGTTTSPGGPGSKTPGVVAQPVARQGSTPPLSVPAVGALLLTILISGALAATSSPILQSPVIHRLGATVRRHLRKEVTPTK